MERYQDYKAASVMSEASEAYASKSLAVVWLS